MGEEEDSVINTGCPSMDLAREVLSRPELDFDPIIKYGGVGENINWKNGYIVVMQHPVTSEFEESKSNIEETLMAVTEIKIPTFWFWPNVDAGSDGTSNGIRCYRENSNTKNIHFFKNMEPDDFLRLIMNSMCLVGNSSVGIRESAFLGVPVVNIGSRQNRRLRASSVIDCGYSKKEIKSSIKKQLKNGKYDSEAIYGDGHAGEKIADILANSNLSSHKTINY